MDFTPLREGALFSSFYNVAPIEPVLYEEEALQPAPVEKPKRVQGKKGKDDIATDPAT